MHITGGTGDPITAAARVILKFGAPGAAERLLAVHVPDDRGRVCRSKVRRRAGPGCRVNTNPPMLTAEAILQRHRCVDDGMCAACRGQVPYPCDFTLMARVARRLNRPVGPTEPEPGRFAGGQLGGVTMNGVLASLSGHLLDLGV